MLTTTPERQLSLVTGVPNATLVAVQLPLSAAYDKVMAGYRAQVAERLARVNAHRKRIGKSPVEPPDFLRKANDFAELLAFGPGGKATVRENVRPIASYDMPDWLRVSTGTDKGIGKFLHALAQVLGEAE